MSKSIIRSAINRTLHLIARVAPGARTLRPFLHRLRGVKVQAGVWIGDDTYLDNEYPERIELHENAGISMRATLVAHTKGPGRIILEKDSFVGVGAVICCPGGREIRIGEGAVVGAGCVITRSVEARTFVVAPPVNAVAHVNVLYTQAADNNEFVCNLVPIKPARPQRKEP